MEPMAGVPRDHRGHPLGQQGTEGVLVVGAVDAQYGKGRQRLHLGDRVPVGIPVRVPHQVEEVEFEARHLRGTEETDAHHLVAQVRRQPVHQERREVRASGIPDDQDALRIPP